MLDHLALASSSLDFSFIQSNPFFPGFWENSSVQSSSSRIRLWAVSILQLWSTCWFWAQWCFTSLPVEPLFSCIFPRTLNMHVLVRNLFCWLWEQFPWQRFCLLHLVFFCGVGVLQVSRVSGEGTILTSNVLCLLLRLHLFTSPFLWERWSQVCCGARCFRNSFSWLWILLGSWILPAYPIPHPRCWPASLATRLPPAGRRLLHDLLPAHGWGGRSLLSCSCPCRALTYPPRATPVSGPSKLRIGPFCSHLVLGFLFQSSAYQKNPHNFSCTGWGREGREKLRGTQNFPSSYNPTLYFKYLCYVIGHFQHLVKGKNMYTVHFCFWVLHRPLPCWVSPSLSFSTF